METTNNEYTQSNGKDPLKMVSEYDDTVARAQNDSHKTAGNESFEQKPEDPNPHHGNETLVDKYNINDKAHVESSTENFVKTISNQPR